MSSGPFGKPLFGKPPAPLRNDESPSAPTSKYNFNFKQSALSSVADNMWNKSKTTFATGQKATPVHLEKKSLNDVLGKMVSESKEIKESDPLTNFVFGSKINEKVVGDTVLPNNSDAKDVESLLKEKPAATKSSLNADSSDNNKFREESAQAAEIMKKEQEKNLASTSIVVVTTGEENDKNIFQTACKLHSFDKERKKWVERGLSQVRINERVEDGQTHYRIVVRSTGNQRVIINSKIFSDMLLERPDAKRTKISAMCPDATTPQIFLLTISFSKTDLCSDQLFNTLQDCLQREKSTEAGNRKRKAEDTNEQEPLDIAKKERIIEEDVTTSEGTPELKSNETSYEKTSSKEENQMKLSPNVADYRGSESSDA